MWLSFALVSALLSATLRIYEKRFSTDFGNFSLGFLTKIAAVPILFVLLFVLPVPADLSALPWAFWWPLIIIWLVLYPVQTYFLYRAIREGELSEVVPVLTLLPVFNIVSSYFLIGEIPTLHGLIGILSIVVGVLLLLTEKRPGAASSVLNMPILFMALAALCIAIGSSLDKISIEVSTPVFYSFANTLGAAIVLLVLSFAYGQGAELKKIPRLGWQLIPFGLVNALLYVAAMYAFVDAPTSYSLAVRSGSFIFAALWGVLILKEVVNARKLIAITLFIGGTFALAFG